MRKLVISLSVLFGILLMPVGLFGGVAYSDYSYRGCAAVLDINATSQCGDALIVWQGAASFAVIGVIVLAVLWMALRIEEART